MALLVLPVARHRFRGPEEVDGKETLQAEQEKASSGPASGAQKGKGRAVKKGLPSLVRQRPSPGPGGKRAEGHGLCLRPELLAHPIEAVTQQEARQRDSRAAANPLLLGAASVPVIREVIPVGASRECSGIKSTLESS